MNLEEQLKKLMEEAPKYGVSSKVMEEAVIPVLKMFAEPLKHQEYYVLQSLEADWVLTTIQNRRQPKIQKKVIYAFPTLKDAETFQGSKDGKMPAKSMSPIDILFQIFAIHQVDSIIFLETPDNFNTSTEIERTKLQNVIHRQIQQLNRLTDSFGSRVPPNFA
jgi:hypothetical protein